MSRKVRKSHRKPALDELVLWIYHLMNSFIRIWCQTRSLFKRFAHRITIGTQVKYKSFGLRARVSNISMRAVMSRSFSEWVGPNRRYTHAILTGFGKSWTLFEMFIGFIGFIAFIGFNGFIWFMLLLLLFVSGVTLFDDGILKPMLLPHLLHGRRAARRNSPGISCRRTRLQ